MRGTNNHTRHPSNNLLGLFEPLEEGNNGNDNDDPNDNSNSSSQKIIEETSAVSSHAPGSVEHMMSLFGSQNNNNNNTSAAASEQTPLLMGDASPITVSKSLLVRDSSAGSVVNQQQQQQQQQQHDLPTPKMRSGNRKSYSPQSNSSSANSPMTSIPMPSQLQKHSRLTSISEQMPETTTTTTSTTSTGMGGLLNLPSLDHTMMHMMRKNNNNYDGQGPQSGQQQQQQPQGPKWKEWYQAAMVECRKPTTYIGSFMYVLYHVVFCLALGSAIIRPHSTTSILGLVTKMAALGPLASSVIYWATLSSQIPSLYPTADLFLAPFLAKLALGIDNVLANDDNVKEEDNDTIFMTTFAVLAGIGICCSGALLISASVFRLANLGSFLPFPVICGFFSAVGVLTWTLAVAVDTGGKSVGHILASGDSQLICFALVHHIPGVIVASIMKYLGPKNPFFVVMVVLGTIVLFYTAMFVTGVSLEEAKQMGWFWSHDELVYKPAEAVKIGFQMWAPPAPFGVINQMVLGSVHWGAVYDGLSTAVAMGFLYLIRCSVHSAALKKNIPNLTRTVRASAAAGDDTHHHSPKPSSMTSKYSSAAHPRKFSEAVDIETVMLTTLGGGASSSDNNNNVQIIHAKPTNITLKEIFLAYGCSQFVSAICGGFAITPSVAASGTMFALGADSVAPQIGSVLLLLIFYLTDFALVGYIPKPAFSSMLVLAFIDMIYTWFYKSYFKTKDKSEWLVVPAIVFCAFAVDLLSAVFLGIAFSTFIFVAAFFRSGVVKFVANGIVLRSTIDRPARQSAWLEEHGDQVQAVVLQNYLFFGNASSVFAYIDNTFRPPQNVTDQHEGFGNSNSRTSQRAQFFIIDLTLVTGMDTSTVDVFSDIRTLCKSNNCKLFMTGMSPNVRSILAAAGFKADTGERSKRQVRFFPNLDAGLGKAEDMLLDDEFLFERERFANDRRKRLLSEPEHGFRTALRHIDEEHGDQYSLELAKLQKYTSVVELNPGERLYEGNTEGLERGLFFIECGVLKIERDAHATLTCGSSMRNAAAVDLTSLTSNDSLTKIQAKSLSSISALLNRRGSMEESQTFRLARIGPGWVAGTLEAVSGNPNPGDHVAVTVCRLHHLPYSKLEEVEKTNPRLLLCLYKLLSFLLAKRQETHVGQLATLHSIMTSPAIVDKRS